MVYKFLFRFTVNGSYERATVHKMGTTLAGALKKAWEEVLVFHPGAVYKGHTTLPT